ncbi:hypothetical protein [Sulfitobacter geojensis]|uniref:Uncharacterized protein n=1 Tax=Sulfitobacter geojensis TaxID=1342299 RepID=A0AAE2VY25_9RHOB|nr:hypothetical protein [Sulfitobacter geojensis]MBM1689277.1 hypothetical protein [Sulfitobacter geojensis]MBM1693343.1 hypothetical protein [Sulfitobacter geojensis]MBM1705509.1 hypothetical protein [Sulfitobacter geojensis]MBM1709567.1 hypothetical protein [Sulfitobacter geojensis]MBM1713633.1 hypothetical protein [Sulfitobacter geojensis]
MIVSLADLLPGDVLLYRANGMKSHQKKIYTVTGSPYTHAAIYLGDGLIADSNFPFGVTKHSVQKSIKGSLCIAILRSQLGFCGDRPRQLNEFVNSTIANGNFYDLIGAVKFGKAKKQHDNNQLEFIRDNYGKFTSSDEYAVQSFFCSAFIVACYSVVEIIGPSAQVAYVPNMFSPGNLHQDPTFGWVLGYIVPEDGYVPDDDPIQSQGTLWRDLQGCRWW